MDCYLAAPHFYLVARIYAAFYLNSDEIPTGFSIVCEGPNYAPFLCWQRVFCKLKTHHFLLPAVVMMNYMKRNRAQIEAPLTGSHLRFSGSDKSWFCAHAYEKRVTSMKKQFMTVLV